MSLEPVLKALGIEARKRGSEWSALCPDPAHNDRNPSWLLRDDPGSERHGLHHCWSCGFSGSLVDLVMFVRRVPYRVAKAWLEGEGHAFDDAPPVATTTNLKVRHNGRNRFHVPDGVDFAPLARWVTPARAYAESRHILPEQVDRWGIGYAVDGPLAGRIVIPYVNAAGRMRGYTARTYIGDTVRYKEPGASEGADGSTMFGERYWDSVSRETVFVAEGALNALAVERALRSGDSWPCVAATAGSSLRVAHAAKLSTFSSIVVLTDPDAAGDKLADQIANECGIFPKITRVRLREGTDADSIGPEELRRAIDERKRQRDLSRLDPERGRGQGSGNRSS